MPDIRYEKYPDQGIGRTAKHPDNHPIVLLAAGIIRV